MINASELRIGNWLMGSHPVQLTAILSADKVGIGSGDPYTVTGGNPCLMPIRLTPSILGDSCGFVLESDGELWSDSEVLWWGKEYCPIQFSNFNLDCTIHGDHVNVKYLHQLQNLYHALTGEELQINL